MNASLEPTTVTLMDFVTIPMGHFTAHALMDIQGQESPVLVGNRSVPWNRTFSYSEKESQVNDVYLRSEEFSNVHTSDRSSNATLLSFTYKKVQKSRSIQTPL